jgi:hypothetical protein
MVEIVVFLLGVLVGAAGIMTYGYAQVKKAKQKLAKKFAEELGKETDDVQQGVKTVTERLTKAQEITDRQLELLAAAEQPSKNALHSQYKNGLAAEIKDLEEEKMDLLHSIIRDGYDPTLNVRIDGVPERIKLSAYLARAGVLPPPLPEEDGPKDPNAPRKVGKFLVYSGGNDGTTH